MASSKKMTGIQRTVIIVCMLTMFIAPFMSSALNLAITTISSEFQAGATTATWIINIYTIGTAAFSMPMGRIADLTGRRRMLIIGTFLFIGFSILCIFAPNIWVLIVARLGMSIGAGAYLAGNIPLALGYFKPQERGHVLGITVTAVYIGLALGPVLGGVINQTLGWRWIFIAGIAVAVVSLIITMTRITDDTTKPDETFDHLGSALFIISLCSLMFGLTEVTEFAWAGAFIAVGVVLLVVFIIHEARIEHPMVQVKLFVGNLTYGFSNLASLLSFGSFFSVGYVMAIYLVNVLGIDTATAGLLMIILPVGQIAFAAYAGKLSDHRSPKIISFCGMLVVAVGLAILAFVHPGFPLPIIMIAMIIIGVGNAFFASPNNNAILSCTTPAHFSEANATIATMRGIGQSLSIVIVSFIFALTIGNTVFVELDPADLAHSISVIMAVGVVIALAAAACCLVGKKVTPGERPAGGPPQGTPGEEAPHE